MSELSSFTSPEIFDAANEREVKPEQAIVLLKPGALEYRERLIEYLKSKDLKILKEKSIRFDRESLYKFYPGADQNIRARYPEDQVRDKTDEFEELFVGQEALSFLVEGKDALSIVGRLKKKVRGVLGLKRPNDGIHASDSPEEALSDKRVIDEIAKNSLNM